MAAVAAGAAAFVGSSGITAAGASRPAGDVTNPLSPALADRLTGSSGSDPAGGSGIRVRTAAASNSASVGASGTADPIMGAPAPAVSSQKAGWMAQKEEQARQRKKENNLKKCEEKIAALELRSGELEKEMSDPAVGTQVAKLQKLSAEQADIRTQLEKLYEEWEVLAQ